MSPTLHRPPSTGDDTHHRFEFLHGIDLERVHVHRPSSRLPWIAAGIVILLLAVAIGVALLGTPSTPDAAGATTWSLHDSGIAQALQAREVAVPATHDSGIAQAVQARQIELDAMHDSGIAQAVQARQIELEAMHDSGIELALRNR
jgi:hypothetical protein